MSALFHFASAVDRHPDVAAWFGGSEPLRDLVRPWFAALRAADEDTRELLHDRRPTACVEDAAFAYVDAFTAHAAVGFLHGAALPDPAGLLEGTGKAGRHVKLRWGQPVDEPALAALIAAAAADMRRRLAAHEPRHPGSA